MVFSNVAPTFRKFCGLCGFWEQDYIATERRPSGEELGSFTRGFDKFDHWFNEKVSAPIRQAQFVPTRT
jgi:hypothetical protein